jgi:hypothetical protein
VTHHTPLVRSGFVGLALAVGLGGVAGGCGGPSGSGTDAAGNQEAPEFAKQLKATIKEKVAKQKGMMKPGRAGAPPRK